MRNKLMLVAMLVSDLVAEAIAEEAISEGRTFVCLTAHYVEKPVAEQQDQHQAKQRAPWHRQQFYTWATRQKILDVLAEVDAGAWKPFRRIRTQH
jgi:hypothetical protein